MIEAPSSAHRRARQVVSVSGPDPKVGRVVPNAPWPVVPLGELAANERNAITDGPFGSKLKTDHYTEAGPRVIRLKNIGDAEFVDAKAHISETHFATLQKHRLFAGDILIAGLGENPPRSCLVPESLGPANELVKRLAKLEATFSPGISGLRQLLRAKFPKETE